MTFARSTRNKLHRIRRAGFLTHSLLHSCSHERIADISDGLYITLRHDLFCRESEEEGGWVGVERGHGKGAIYLREKSEREGGIKGVRTTGRRDERGWRGGEEDRGIDKRGENVKREGRGDI
jgi:hypothetical protein